MELDPEQLMRMGVTFEKIATALQSASLSIPAGGFESADRGYVIVVDERFRSRSEVV